MNISFRRALFVSVGLAVVLSLASFAQEKKEAAGGHGIVSSTDLKWTPILAGWEFAVVSGNPDKDGEPFVIRLHGKDGAKVPAHWHPTDENVTTLKGTLLVGLGEKYDAAQMQPIAIGGFALMPKEMRHFACAKGDTIVQVHGVGPFKINWVNPADVVPPETPKKM